MSRSRSESGFTLIEVLVGLALLSALLGGIYTVAVGSMVAKRTIQESAAGPEILDLIERDLRAAYISGVKDRRAFKAQKQAVGGADVTILDLVTTTNSKVSVEIDKEWIRSDVTEVGYRMKTSSDFPDFLELYRREQFFFDDEPLAGGQYYLVYDRLISLKLTFFEAPDPNSTSSSRADTEGYEDWDTEDKEGKLPQAVKVVLVLASPPELLRPGAQDEAQYTFVRWVLLPNGFDKEPKATGDTDTGNPGGG